MDPEVHDSILYDTLEDDAWKDSFDKLLEPRTILREQNVIKKDVRASFNINSSVENCSRDDSSLLAAGTASPVPFAIQQLLITRDDSKKRQEYISTPTQNRLLANPFKCSLSPIGAWKQLFGKSAKTSKLKEMETVGDKFHATPLNPEILIVDYDEEQNDINIPIIPVSTQAITDLSPLPIPRRSSKSNRKNQNDVILSTATQEITDISTLKIARKSRTSNAEKQNDAIISIITPPIIDLSPPIPRRRSKSNRKKQNDVILSTATQEITDLSTLKNERKSRTSNANKQNDPTITPPIIDLSPPIPRKSSKSNGKKRTHRRVCFETVDENSILQTRPSKSKKASLDVSVSFCRSEHGTDEIIVKKAPELVPGKWRKSLIVWRRTQQLPSDQRRSSKCVRVSEHVEHAVTVADKTIAGRRKSVLQTTHGPVGRELNSNSICQTNDEWQLRVLQRCAQSKPLQFEELYAAVEMQECRKIGEGAYGEVFLKSSAQQLNKDTDTVLKIIPIEGDLEINGEVQKTYEQILPEIIISLELCSLRNDSSVKKSNATCGFVAIKRVACIQGKYPDHLLKMWDDYDESKGSENDHPKVFDECQLYIVLELAFGGKDLEAFVFNNAEQSYHALQQIIMTLAVGEEAFQFEHRDLHWGNILIQQTNEKHISYKLKNKLLTAPTKGVKITIIDYTLSRMTYDDCCLYNDLSSDEELFAATGDYQFEIYRMMRDVLKNNWETYEPKTNVFWISYLITKMLNNVGYKNTRSKTHTIYLKKLKQLNDIVLDFDSAVACANHLWKTADY